MSRALAVDAEGRVEGCEALTAPQPGPELTGLRDSGSGTEGPSCCGTQRSWPAAPSGPSTLWRSGGCGSSVQGPGRGPPGLCLQTPCCVKITQASFFTS